MGKGKGKGQGKHRHATQLTSNLNEVIIKKVFLFAAAPGSAEAATASSCK